MQSQPTLRRIIYATQDALSDQVCAVIFPHYHSHDFISPGYLKLIESAVSMNYRVFFVSPTRPSRLVNVLPMSCITYIHRRNVGYDFGALRDARDVILSGPRPDGRVLIINSSMLNLASPGFGEDPVLDALASPPGNYDLVGVTSSYECCIYHIQTYFYSMSSAFFCSDIVETFLSRYFERLATTQLSPRAYAIKHGELNLTRLAIEAGYSVTSLFSELCLPAPTHYSEMTRLYDGIESLIGNQTRVLMQSSAFYPDLKTLFLSEWISRPGLQTNVSQACWALMISKGFLFIKRELLESRTKCSPIAPSAPALLLPLLAVLKIDIPSWSDLGAMPDILYGSIAKREFDA